MAASPSHKFGQIIGDLLEAATRSPLAAIATELGLYFDYKRPRRARGGKRKVAWTDNLGNIHDLDYVFEAGGTEEKIGQPKAFIEIAWRRYTKHSRNKAQEIQGAVIPLAERYNHARPFLGVVLGGVFTTGSLAQLSSHGFHILFYPYEDVVAAFAEAGIDAHFDESTSDKELQRKVEAFEVLSNDDKQRIVKKLRSLRKDELAAFERDLRTSLQRSVKTVRVLTLHGEARELASVEDAIEYIEEFDETSPRPPFVRYELWVVFSNGDEIRGEFQDKASAMKFLRALATP